MKLVASVILILLNPELSRATTALDYVLQAVEYLSAEHHGVFSCVFYDIGPSNPFKNILGQVLKSPRLNHVVKYVIHGPYGDRIEELPSKPTLLIVNAGDDLEHLIAVKRDVGRMLRLFNPTTTVLAIVDFSNMIMVDAITGFVTVMKYVYSVYLDVGTMQIRQCNLVNCYTRIGMIRFGKLFGYKRRSMKGRNITYFSNEDGMVPYWNMKWIEEVARYLHTAAVHYKHDCKGSDQEFNNCMAKYRSTNNLVDIGFSTVVDLTPEIPKRNFRTLYTSVPLFVKILVPRERPYNTFELMLMPFTSNVWILLVTILVSTEIAKRLFPVMFKNDPILLVVCGFERHILHRANRWEKTIFISLIILMFFMRHAFETKFISLIVSRPSIQRVKTLEDLYGSGLKIYADLENNPHYRDHPVIGRLVVQGINPGIGENVPGIAKAYISEWADLVLELSYDPIRMQSFYVPLDYLDFAACEAYEMSFRSQFLEVFRRIHLTLVEAGLIGLYKQQYSDQMRADVRRDRSTGRTDVIDKGLRNLDFTDMKVAWVVFGSGAGIGLLCFLVESTRKPFNMLIVWIKAIQNCN